MIDRPATALIRPTLDRIARRLARHGIGADALTFTGLAVGWAAAAAIALQAYWLGAALILWGWQAFRPTTETGAKP